MHVQLSKAKIWMGVVALLGCLAGCSDNGGGDEDSSSSAQETSSSSFSGREDIAYGDTIRLDTLYTHGLPAQEGERWFLYLGYFPKGTQLTVWAATQNVEGPQLRIRAEGSRKYLVPLDPLATGFHSDYMEPATDTSTLAGNDFFTLDSGYYVLELDGIIQDEKTPYLRTHIIVQRSRYAFTGGTDTLELKAGDTLRGFFPLAQGGEATLQFRSPTGYNLNISAQGSRLDTLWLTDSASGAVLASGKNALKRQLLPRQQSSWSVDIRPIAATYMDGPYAFFSVILNSLQLLKGEYFAMPDSIVRPGDTLVNIRPRNDAALYEVRHDHYVWLGDCVVGDSLVIHHGNFGFTSIGNPALNILNAQGDSIATLSAARDFGFRAQVAGPYYLHYYRTNGYANDSSLKLTLTTVVQRPSSLQAWTLLKEDGSALSSYTLPKGDTLHFDLDLDWAPTPVNGSLSAKWYLPCSELDNYSITNWPVRDGRSTSACTGETTQILGGWLVGNKAGTTVHLISQSVADPTRSDTLLIIVP